MAEDPCGVQNNVMESESNRLQNNEKRKRILDCREAKLTSLQAELAFVYK